MPKIDGNTLVHINGQGHLIYWMSERLDKSKEGPSDDLKNSKFDRYRDDSDEENDKEDSKGSHDSGFARLARE
jgi:hypothetical protein